jgi:hypothetical protein
MTKNMGTADRVIRTVIGLAILTAGLFYKSWWGLVGLVPLFTATTGWCALYAPFGISTCAAKKT